MWYGGIKSGDAAGTSSGGRGCRDATTQNRRGHGRRGPRPRLRERRRHNRRPVSPPLSVHRSRDWGPCSDYSLVCSAAEPRGRIRSIAGKVIRGGMKAPSPGVHQNPICSPSLRRARGRDGLAWFMLGDCGSLDASSNLAPGPPGSRCVLDRGTVPARFYSACQIGGPLLRGDEEASRWSESPGAGLR